MGWIPEVTDIFHFFSFGCVRTRIAKRDAARERGEAKRQAARDERVGAGPGGANERINAMREKEKQTMEMFKNMAKQKFG